MRTSTPEAPALHAYFPGRMSAGTLPDALIPAASCAGPGLDWRAHDQGWLAEIALPELPAGTLCVPSLILGATAPLAYAIRFEWGTDGSIDLAPVCVDPSAHHPWPKARMDRLGSGDAHASGGLDCVEIHDPIPAPRLVVHALGEAAPEDAVLLVSMRQRYALPSDDGELAAPLAVPGFSQMTRSPDIARHVCSPVSVAMVLATHGHAVEQEAFARSCEHPDHGQMFGLWPLNLARAWRHGLGGMVRSFSSAAQAARVLEQGLPLIVSIRFGAGELPGAPLPRTGGHLVVLRGLDATQVLVNDPAAASDAEVEHRYDRTAFMQAWLADRGVGYVLWPRASHHQGASGRP